MKHWQDSQPTRTRWTASWPRETGSSIYPVTIPLSLLRVSSLFESNHSAFLSFLRIWAIWATTHVIHKAKSLKPVEHWNTVWTPFLVPCHFPIPGYAREGGPILRRVPTPNGGAPLSKRVLDPEMGLNHWGFGKEGWSGVGRNPSQHYGRTRCRLLHQSPILGQKGVKCS